VIEVSYKVRVRSFDFKFLLLGSNLKQFQRKLSIIIVGVFVVVNDAFVNSLTDALKATRLGYIRGQMNVCKSLLKFLSGHFVFIFDLDSSFYILDSDDLPKA